jgi:cytochrome b6
MSTQPSAVGRLVRFVHERFPTEKLSFAALVGKKEVPVHRMSWAYYMGGLVLFFFGIQMATGLLLLFYYQPSVSDAYSSVEYITHHVSGGALVRNLHAWSASAMIFFLLVHMLTAFAMKAFAKPREITWVTGVALLVLAFAFGFTGYLLPWNQIAVNATKVGLQSIELIGQYLPGDLAEVPTRLREAIQGEASVGQATLSRFHAIHVVVLPLIALGVVGMHLFSVQIHGMSQGVDEPTTRTERFFPFFILKDFSLWGSTPDGIKPEWYFFFVYYPLELLPFWLVNLLMMGGVGVLLFAPWIFRNTSRRVLRAVTLAIAAYLVVITLFGQQIYELIVGGH